MNCFHVHHRLLLICVFFIVSTLAKTKVPSPPLPPGLSPNLLPVSVSFPDTVPKPKKYLTLSSLFRSLIQVRAPSSTQVNFGGHPRRRSHGKWPLSFQSDAPGPGPSPTLRPVSSPINAEPEMSPTSPPFPSWIQVGAPPFPRAGSQGRLGRRWRGKVPLSYQSDAQAEVPTSSPGPSPNLQPVTSPVSAEPKMSPTSSPFPSLIQVGATPSPQDGSQGRSRNSHRKVPLSLRSYKPTSSPGPGPSPTLQPVLSPKSSPSPLPASPSGGSEESPEGPDGDRSQETQSDEPGSDAIEEEEMEMDYPGPEQETGDAIVDVKKVCETTDYPSLCTNTVAPLVNSKNKVSLDSVLAASINATDDLAKAALLAAKQLANAPGTPPELTSVFEVCEESYGEALDNFDKAKEAYDTQDVGTMNTMFSAVISNMEDCNTEFSSLNIPSPVAEISDRLRNMTSNCLAIVSLLQY